MKRKLLYMLLAAMTMVMASCDNIAEEDRLIYVPRVKAARSILVEEFSGQLCVNCPVGSAVLETLQEQHSADTVIVVSFHAERSVNRGIPASWTSLCTEEGNTLFDSYGANSMPVAVFDRKSGLVDNYQLWNAYTSAVLQIPTTLSLAVNTDYTESNRQLTVSVTASQSADATAALSGKLHVWLTEDSVVAEQLLSGGTENGHVFHNIFRSTLNPLSDDDITVSTTGATQRTFTTTIPATCRPENMHVVVFVDNSDGVAQAARASVVNE